MDRYERTNTDRNANELMSENASVIDFPSPDYHESSDDASNGTIDISQNAGVQRRTDSVNFQRRDNVTAQHVSSPEYEECAYDASSAVNNISQNTTFQRSTDATLTEVNDDLQHSLHSEEGSDDNNEVIPLSQSMSEFDRQRAILRRQLDLVRQQEQTRQGRRMTMRWMAYNQSRAVRVGSIVGIRASGVRNDSFRVIGIVLSSNDAGTIGVATPRGIISGRNGRSARRFTSEMYLIGSDYACVNVETRNLRDAVLNNRFEDERYVTIQQAHRFQYGHTVDDTRLRRRCQCMGICGNRCDCRRSGNTCTINCRCNGNCSNSSATHS